MREPPPWIPREEPPGPPRVGGFSVRRSAAIAAVLLVVVAGPLG
ncbi:MAG TPA: hypothetical protein VKL22_04900 [Actinomycetota bacterium]|nr:hypothetical protein [Actinomycetota bacterium]